MIYLAICHRLSLLSRFLEGRLGRAYMTTGEKVDALKADMLDSDSWASRSFLSRKMKVSIRLAFLLVCGLYYQ